MSIALLLLLGPDKIEVTRVSTICEGMKCYEPERIGDADLYLANDGNAHHHELAREFGWFRRVILFDNPLQGRSPYYRDRFVAGTFEGLRRISRKDYDFVLKMDTDAMIVRPFIDRVMSFFRYYPRAGIIGTYAHYPTGAARPGNLSAASIVSRSGWLAPRPLHLATHPNPTYHWTVCRLTSMRRKIVALARGHLYRGSDHVQGGAYALSGTLLRELQVRNWPLDPRLFMGTNVGEDVSTAILCKACGFELMDFNRPGEVFGVWPGPPRLSLKEISKRGYALIHSVKERPDFSETTARSWFFGDTHRALTHPVVR